MTHPTAYITTALLAALIAWGVRRMLREPDRIGDALRDYRESGGGR